MFDYIVVGSGAAGAVIAARLSEDPTVQVLLIESGPRDSNPLFAVPKGFFYTLRSPRYTFDYETRPAADAQQVEHWKRGRVLGGSTAVNGMMHVRGQRADYDAFEAMGLPHLCWDKVLSAYLAIEDHQLGASPMRGVGGPFGVSIPHSDDEVVAALIQAGTGLGWSNVADINGEDGERIGFTPSAVKDGRRVSSSTAFLRPHRKRSNLHVATRSHAVSVVLEGRRAVGVRVRTRRTTREYRARHEVIVCGGSFESSLLLERSGIGHPDVLGRAGIEVRIPSPQIGERVIEQRGVSMQARLRDPIGPTQELNSWGKQARQTLRYLITGSGPLATPAYDLICQFKSDPSLDRPDIQGIWTPLALEYTPRGAKLAQHSGILFMGYQIRPTTTSSVHVSGPTPDHPPAIEGRFLLTDADRRATGTILATARRMLEQSPVVDYILDEEIPGTDVRTPDDVVAYALRTGSGICHAVGANAMGVGSDDPVDPEFRVRGAENLRVADVSVFPQQPAGNTAAPTMALAWIAADRILADRA